MWMWPTPVVHISHLMGVCYASHLLLLFVSRVQWGCASTTPTCRLHFATDEVCFGPHHFQMSFAFCNRQGCTVLATSFRSLCLTFDKGMLWHPPLCNICILRPIECVLCQCSDHDCHHLPFCSVSFSAPILVLFPNDILSPGPFILCTLVS